MDAPGGDQGGLDSLEAGDLGRWKRAVAAGDPLGFGYYFAYLLIRHRAARSRVLLAEESGSLCAFLWRRREEGAPRLDLLLPPVPMQERALARCLERANDLNRNRAARVLRVDEQDVARVRGTGALRVEARRSQYLYAPSAFRNIGGRRYRTLRRNVTLIEKRSDVEVLPFQDALREECLALTRSWARRHRRELGTAGGAGTTRRTIELAGSLPESELRGEVIRVGGRVAAFAFGGEVRPGLGCFLEAKSDPGVPGLAYFQRYHFLSGLSDLDLVNDGSDTGREGLRQLKDSLRPAAMHAEHRAFQDARTVVQVPAPRRSDPGGIPGTSPRIAPPGHRSVGLLCNCAQDADPIRQLSPSLLNRAFLLAENLAPDGIDVFLFCPKDVGGAESVPGFRIEGRRLLPATGPVPRVNANWTYGTRRLLEGGMGYKRFKNWAKRSGIGVYVPYEFSELVSNKLKAYRAVRDFDASLHPNTEDFVGTPTQVESLTSTSGLAFIKPRAGNKGNRIFVLRRQGSDFSLQYYDTGQRRRLAPVTLAAALGVIDVATSEKRYVIQPGIESARHLGSVFDVRVVMVQDGRSWHSILETRLAPGDSDLSNVFQGGSIHAAPELLGAVFGNAGGREVTARVRRVSHGLARHLEQGFPGELMEIGFDFVIDGERRPHLVEVNAKPGVAGFGSEVSILEWRPEDEEMYRRWVHPHVTHLASFLRGRLEAA